MGELCGGKGRPELARARKRRGMTQEAAAEAVGVSAAAWGRWERGEQGVRAYSRQRIAAVFEVDAMEVERWIEGWAFTATSSWPNADFGDGSQAATVKAVTHLWRCELDSSRREMLAALPFVPAALGEWLVSWSYGVPVESTAHHGSGPLVGLSDVTRINESHRAFGQMDQRFGAGVVRPVVMNYLNSSVTPLLRGRYNDKVGAELMVAAAGMTELAGWTAFDLGHHGKAQHHFGQALKLAKAGNDLLAGAWVLMTLTQQAIYLQQPRWAEWLARAAVDTARRAGAPPRVMALMLVKEAGAMASRTKGDATPDGHVAKQVERLLAEAERAYDQGSDDRDPEWLASYGRPGLVAAMGCCWQQIGEHRRAAAFAETAIQGYDGRFIRAVQFVQANAAEAYLGTGELEQGIARARAAIPAIKALASPRLVERLRQFAGQLEPYKGSMMVREFRDHLNHELAA
ncbi:helix-turn-helix transcriptional regulator [Streptosporangium sp. NBC_01469]|uniref:helix-turn-helix transcriptional regulator n=1 Tax=Streptosporangium sp. NBC_01469 TaxID=2903898 RepID=UPI002E2E1A28|nr:helix-turn-helix transcriptional regulator [Streptosporangium sp. NBC_01469]